MSKNDKTVATKMKDLQEMIDWFNSDDFTLEAALDKFKEAQAVAESVEHDLSGLKNDIEVAKQKVDESTGED